MHCLAVSSTTISNNKINENGADFVGLREETAFSSSAASSSSSSSSTNSSCDYGLDGIGIMDTTTNAGGGDAQQKQKASSSPTKRSMKAQMKKSLHLDLLSISNACNNATTNGIIGNAGFSSPASAAAERLNSGILSPWNQPQFQQRKIRPSKIFPVNIMPYLYLGNDETAKSRETLHNCGIHYVINVTSDLPNYFEEQQWQQQGNNHQQQQRHQQGLAPPDHENGTGNGSGVHAGNNIVYMRIPVDDNCSHNLAQFFPKAIAFIERARSQHAGVLVHCWAGISRSVTICLAYLMYSLRCTLEEAFDRLLKQNGTIAPNFHFMEALTRWERELIASSFSSTAMGICLSSASPTPTTTTAANGHHHCNSSSSSSNGGRQSTAQQHPRSPSAFMVGTS